MPSGPILDVDWSAGIVRDAPRSSIPDGGFYDAGDFLFHKPGIAEKRGGTVNAGPALSGASYAWAVGYAPFPAGAQLVGVGSDGHLYKVTDAATTDVGTLGSAFLTLDTPKFRVGGSKNLLVICANDGTTAPKTWNGTTAATLGGSPPAGKFATVYKTRLALANTSANPDRIFFSDVPDIESAWDTTNSWVDTDYPVTGLASLQNALIVFSSGRSQRITGSTPPPGSDFDRAPIGDVGCTDARSIVIYEGRVIFANQRGVYWTDGINYKSLTRDAGVETLWRSYFTPSIGPNHISAGLLGSFLFVTIRNTSDALVATLMCNLARNTWWPITNINSMMFASSVATQDECYYADKNTPRLVKLSALLNPAVGNKNDADGTAVEPMLETRILGGGPTLKHFGHGHLSYDMRDGDVDNPVLAVSAAPGVEATTFVTSAGSPFPETTDETRVRFTVGKVSQGVTLRFEQTGASSKTEIYAAELEAEQLAFQSGGE